ncbi:unnamed protein product, partial [Dracunculus medinensis]|uniref:Uncharacterized protein n=1 Tax=Dracunculus medinensis TaxID=318479 RepID=A0A0N4U528_DRAME
KNEDDEVKRRADAEAAFSAWLNRKKNSPKGPRFSPTREQIAQHLREDARHRFFNTWWAKSQKTLQNKTENLENNPMHR